MLSKIRKTFYRLCPEEYDGRLYEILGWERRNNSAARPTPQHYGDKVMLTVTGLTFPAMPPLSFQIRSGEIAFLRDENYNTVSRIRDCFLGEQRWLSGIFCLDGRVYEHAELAKVIGTKIGVQIERPDRPGGVLFDNLTALDNLSTCLLPKAGRHIVRRNLTENILSEVLPVGSAERRCCARSVHGRCPNGCDFSYFKWYFLNPQLLI